MSGDVEVREALDRLTQAAKDYAGIDDPDSMEAVDEDYRLVGAALADAERTAGEQIQANFALTAQLQAAQATIGSGLSAVDFWLDEGFKHDMAGDTEGRDEAIDIVVRELRKSLSRADTSAHDAAILAARFEAWGEGYESGVNDIANGSTPMGNSIDPEPNPYRASIEQTEADRG